MARCCCVQRKSPTESGGLFLYRTSFAASSKPQDSARDSRAYMSWAFLPFEELIDRRIPAQCRLHVHVKPPERYILVEHCVGAVPQAHSLMRAGIGQILSLRPAGCGPNPSLIYLCPLVSERSGLVQCNWSVALGRRSMDLHRPRRLSAPYQL